MGAEVCPTCGAKVVEYKHNLNRLNVRALRALYRTMGGIAVHLNEDLRLTYNEQANFQKLRYFGLVEKAYDADGLRLGGRWSITNKGRLFVAGIGYCYPSVWTFRGEPIRFEGEPVEISDVVADVDEREDYVANAVARGELEDVV